METDELIDALRRSIGHGTDERLELERHRTKMLTITLNENNTDRVLPNCGVPELLVELGPWAERLLAEVPAEYRDRVKFEVKTEYDYDGPSYADVHVYYERPETKAERDARAAEDRAARKSQAADYRNRELAELARLKAKHEEA